MKCGKNSYRAANDSSQICRCFPGFERYYHDQYRPETPCHGKTYQHVVISKPSVQEVSCDKPQTVHL